MSDLSSTLASLLKIGFERRPDSFGMPTVGYRFRALDLTASDCLGRNFVPVVLLSGALSSGRAVAEIHSELPQTLQTPEIAAAWVSYALKPHREKLEQLPEWMLEGERNWDALPFGQHQREASRRQQEYERRPLCLIDREHARLLRRSLSEALSRLRDSSVMTFHFDGRVLNVRLDGRSIDALATGAPWPNSYEIAVTRGTKLPARFSYAHVEVSYFDDALHFDRRRYPAATEATG